MTPGVSRSLTHSASGKLDELTDEELERIIEEAV